MYFVSISYLLGSYLSRRLRGVISIGRWASTSWVALAYHLPYLTFKTLSRLSQLRYTPVVASAASRHNLVTVLSGCSPRGKVTGSASLLWKLVIPAVIRRPIV